MSESKYKFLFISAFCLPDDSPFSGPKRGEGIPKEERLQNYQNVKHLLADVDWDMHPGAMTTYGNWTVENRQEFLYAAAGRIPIVQEACESGKYNAIILEGGGEPGFMEARELTRRYGIPVTSCGHSQMHFASMLGNKFAIIDFSDVHTMFFHNLVVQHRMTDRCASIRNIGYYHSKPHYKDAESFSAERRKAMAGEPSEAVERAVSEAINAIEEDGADVIMFGCSGSFWLKPFVEKRLHDEGWEVPVIEGYGAAIELAKIQVDYGVTASGLAFPGDRPKKRPRKIVF
ncbi:MAG: aspartate/glutamate racemase family protein [Alphaproteobacteria bacterium]|nr:aspartate/glutamate racemase family protein [Alphaproteobacteria bacterium]